MSSQAAGQDGAADFSDSEFEFDCPQWTDFSQDNYDEDENPDNYFTLRRSTLGMEAPHPSERSKMPQEAATPPLPPGPALKHHMLLTPNTAAQAGLSPNAHAIDFGNSPVTVVKGPRTPADASAFDDTPSTVVKEASAEAKTNGMQASDESDTSSTAVKSTGLDSGVRTGKRKKNNENVQHNVQRNLNAFSFVRDDDGGIFGELSTREFDEAEVGAEDVDEAQDEDEEVHEEEEISADEGDLQGEYHDEVESCQDDAQSIESKKEVALRPAVPSVSDSVENPRAIAKASDEQESTNTPAKEVDGMIEKEGEQVEAVLNNTAAAASVAATPPRAAPPAAKRVSQLNNVAREVVVDTFTPSKLMSGAALRAIGTSSVPLSPTPPSSPPGSPAQLPSIVEEEGTKVEVNAGVVPSDGAEEDDTAAAAAADVADANMEVIEDVTEEGEEEEVLMSGVAPAVESSPVYAPTASAPVSEDEAIARAAAAAVANAVAAADQHMSQATAMQPQTSTPVLPDEDLSETMASMSLDHTDTTATDNKEVVRNKSAAARARRQTISSSNHRTLLSHTAAAVAEEEKDNHHQQPNGKKPVSRKSQADNMQRLSRSKSTSRLAAARPRAGSRESSVASESTAGAPSTIGASSNGGAVKRLTHGTAPVLATMSRSRMRRRPEQAGNATATAAAASGSADTKAKPSRVRSGSIGAAMSRGRAGSTGSANRRKSSGVMVKTQPAPFTFASDRRAQVKMATRAVADGGAGAGGNDTKFRPTLAAREGPPKPTKPKPFHFASDRRADVKSMTAKVLGKELPAASSPYESLLNKHTRNMHAMRESNDDSSSTGGTGGTGFALGAKPLSKTMPKTPNLATRKRMERMRMLRRADGGGMGGLRGATLSTEEREELEILQHPKFKARKVDRRILDSAGGIGVPKVPKQQTCKPQEFNFHTTKRATQASSKRLSLSAAATTAAHNKAIEMQRRRQPRPPSPITREKKAPTVPQPFHLASEQRHEYAVQQRALQMQREAEEAEIARAFHSRAVPQYPNTPTPKPSMRQLTEPETPIVLQRSIQAKEELQHKLMMQKEAERQQAHFSASVPPETTYRPGFVAKRGLDNSHITVPVTPHCKTATRAVERAKFDHLIKLHVEEADRRKQNEELAKKIREERELKEMRQKLVHKPLPVPKSSAEPHSAAGGVLAPGQHVMELTDPQSPYLRTRVRGEGKAHMMAAAAAAGSLAERQRQIDG